MEKISNKELVALVAERTELTKKVVKEVMETAANIVERAAMQGKATAFVGLGKFYPADRAARTAHNPMTGAAVEVPPKRVLAFKPSAGMKDI